MRGVYPKAPFFQRLDAAARSRNNKASDSDNNTIAATTYVPAADGGDAGIFRQAADCGSRRAFVAVKWRVRDLPAAGETAAM